MGRTVLSFALSVVLLVGTSCKSDEDYRREAETLRRNLPAEYLRTGMISSSTYQVYYRVSARSQNEAVDLARNESEPLALKYLLKEPFIYVNVSQYGVQRLKEIVHKKGRIVAVQKADENNAYDIVFHITDYGLREQFQQVH